MKKQDTMNINNSNFGNGNVIVGQNTNSSINLSNSYGNEDILDISNFSERDKEIIRNLYNSLNKE